MVKRALYLLLTALIALPVAAQAGTIKSLEQEIFAFKKSGDHRYAPLTTSRVEAYLGAAMLADGEQREGEAAAAVKKAEEKLAEAKSTAAGFRQQFASLLALRSETSAVAEIVSTTPEEGKPLASQQMVEAENALNQAIVTRERGELNRTLEHAATAKSAYSKVLNSNLDQLSVITARLISKARSCGSKRYAPVTHQAASEKLAELRGYIDGLFATPPSKPSEAYALAAEANAVCEQVKLWKKESSSYEEIIIRERTFRHNLAKELDIETPDNVLLVTNSPRELLDATKRLKGSLSAEREARKKAEREAEAKARMVVESDEQMQAQRSQLTDMKEVFRAKLERETADKKMQERLRNQFKEGDAEIFVNLDGSLLLRMVGLQFTSGSSKVTSEYFDLISRLKGALDVYADRTVRIEGHTDDQGDVKPNQQLSLKRAESVRDVLIEAGADGSRLKALGYGEVRPIASNEFPQGRAMNRRIDIVIDAPQ
ncbi:OmpA family protein [Mariprofundus ferrinatatus]|uniref:OmpA family protein n=1 Tax=Mariprofundus ferrinatatus TaxID=1921087 RepID=A0A2K8L8T6_9PROT|nr:OmpA family protein [Mariprofundus ferrinatatus]ATX82301.1 OmpA family protein [Mariprofundus ferrinatatus]